MDCAGDVPCPLLGSSGVQLSDGASLRGGVPARSEIQRARELAKMVHAKFATHGGTSREILDFVKTKANTLAQPTGINKAQTETIHLIGTASLAT